MATTNFTHQITGMEAPLEEFAYQLTKDKETAIQLYRDTVQRALQQQDKFPANRDLKLWLFAIMRRICASNYCKQSKRPLLSKEPASKAGPAPQSTNYAALMNDIQLFVDGTEEHYRKIFTLHYYGYSHQEIAVQLEIPVAVVKQGIMDARRELKTKYAKKR